MFGVTFLDIWVTLLVELCVGSLEGHTDAGQKWGSDIMHKMYYDSLIKLYFVFSWICCDVINIACYPDFHWIAGKIIMITIKYYQSKELRIFFSCKTKKRLGFMPEVPFEYLGS